MKYRVDFERRVDAATRAGQAGMKWSVEVIARNEAEARRKAVAEAARVKKDRMYHIKQVRKI